LLEKLTQNAANTSKLWENIHLVFFYKLDQLIGYIRMIHT